MKDGPSPPARDCQYAHSSYSPCCVEHTTHTDCNRRCSRAASRRPDKSNLGTVILGGMQCIKRASVKGRTTPSENHSPSKAASITPPPSAASFRKRSKRSSRSGVHQPGARLLDDRGRDPALFRKPRRGKSKRVLGAIALPTATTATTAFAAPRSVVICRIETEPTRPRNRPENLPATVSHPDQKGEPERDGAWEPRRRTG